jgi:SOS-response transcriptional repressor LexA
MELSHRTLAIYKELQRFADLHGYVHSLRELGGIEGCSASTIKRHLERLQKAGLIERAGRSARSYVIRGSQAVVTSTPPSSTRSAEVLSPNSPPSTGEG